MAHHTPPLVVHVIYALTTGGLENGLVNIINRSPVDRYRHTIVCITGADDFATRITAPRVEIIEMHKRPGHDLGFYWRLLRLFRRLRPDIIHTRNLAALETQVLSVFTPGVCRVHGEHGREISDVDGSNSRYLALRKWLRPLVHGYIAVSQDLQHWLTDQVKVPAEKVTQIYNGVDHEKFAPRTRSPAGLLPLGWNTSEDQLVVGTVGRLSPIKDQRALLLAVARLRDTAPGVFARLRLVIVGDGPERQNLAQASEELQLGDRVWFAGARDDVPALYRCMDLFVLPSLGEGISNTLLEAMASGLPVLATAVGGNLELVEPGFNGQLVPAADPEVLAETMQAMLEDGEVLRRQGVNARQRVCQRFDWDTTVNAYLGIYDELLQRPGARPVGSTG